MIAGDRTLELGIQARDHSHSVTSEDLARGSARTQQGVDGHRYADRVTGGERYDSKPTEKEGKYQEREGV